ncbi:hypothetical protein [Oceanobacillus sp. CAU 1775]
MKEKQQIREQLVNELKDIRFTKKAEVLKQIEDRSWKTKFHRLWNKEISIPLLPVSSVFAVFLFAYGVFQISEMNPNYEIKETIVIGGNMYVKEDVERRLADED